MRKFNRKQLAARLAAFSATVISGIGTAMADTPTTATALAQTVDLSDAKSAGLIVVGLLVSAGVVLWGARLVLSKFRPKV